jgi:hypothetical protein
MDHSETELTLRSELPGMPSEWVEKSNYVTCEFESKFQIPFTRVTKEYVFAGNEEAKEVRHDEFSGQKKPNRT